MLLTGGGTGGHITPLLAVAHELKLLEPNSEVIYVGEHRGKFGHLTDGQQDIDGVHTVFAGKFRRYHGQSWLRRLFDIKTILLNIRDLFYLLIGIVQSWFLIGRLKPNVIFLKGGFVGVPIGVAARLRQVPFMTHDSDALPGLANRLVGRWARLHATALPADNYSYPRADVRHVGVLVSPDYAPVQPQTLNDWRQELDLPTTGQILLITGGSLGASRLNRAVIDIIDKLLQDNPGLYIVHQVGKGKIGEYRSYTNERLRILEFLRPMHKYTAVADAVVTRAGANTLAELGVQGKACIVVPNPQLTDGHQTKNAQQLSQKNAVIVVSEDELPAGLDQAIRDLLNDTEKQTQLGEQFKRITIPDAAHKLAKLIQELAEEQDGPRA